MMDKINELIKMSMKQKNKSKLDALRFLKSKLIENKTSEKPKDEQDIVISHIKKLRDSIDQYPEGHEQRNKIEEELSHLGDFMPKQLNESEVIALIQEIIQNQKNFGLVMKELSPQIKGKFDTKQVPALVKAELAKST
jgi:uncharacterized protein YqeY